MNKIIFYIFLTVIFTACDKSDINSDTGLFTRTITVDGVSRRYAIYIPEGIEDIAVPIVYELHGGGIYIEDMTGESGYKTPYKLWTDIADKEKFIVIYPEGLNGSYGKPTWNDCRGNCIVSSNADDIKFISVLTDKIISTYKVDESRIYVSGTSNGGLMALRTASELSDRIAAVAAVAASMPDTTCCNAPENPISVLFMNGTDDNHLPYEGGFVSYPPNPDYGSVYSTEYSVDFWKNFNHTDSIPDIFVFPDRDTSDGGIVERYTYKNGVENTEVVLYKINGGGHSAPSIKEQYSALFEEYFNKQNHDIEMTDEVWAFFKDKRL
ncbi:MAG: hypothetical protein GXO50_05650 [Chlorobi bacterium]|nr:hypothetical protein [Chlorobiota bacterium]